MKLHVEGVWCKTRTEFERLAKSGEYDLTVSYFDIFNRLIKSDPYSKEPSDIIVSLYIRKLIQRLLSDTLEKEKEGAKILYMFKTLDTESVSGFKDFNGDKWQQYLIVVDSVFCVKTKAEQDKLFNKIQDLQVETNIRDLFNLSNRTTYTGNYNFHTKGEFVKALQKFLGDKYPKDADWSDSVLYRPNHDEMDRGEWV